MTVPAFAMWIFLALVQGEGAVGNVSGSLAGCEEGRKEAMANPMVLAISECVELKMTPQPKES